jgi:hypothetical protein
MTARRLVEIGVRIWGLSLILQLPWSLPSLALTFGVPGDAYVRAATVGSIAGAALILISAVLLFVYAPASASRLVPESDVVTTSVDAYDVAGIAIVLFSIAMLVGGAQDVVSSAYRLAALPSWDETGNLEFLMNNHKEEVVRGVVLVTAGAVLIWQRNALREWMSR